MPIHAIAPPSLAPIASPTRPVAPSHPVALPQPALHLPAHGVCIHTIVDPKLVSRSAWQRVYDETVTVLRAWPDPPMRPRHRVIAGVELVVGSREVVSPEVSAP